MKLIRFTASKVHGFLPYDVTFDQRLTFLTGINGSGKTTALNLIVALISPNLFTLQAVDFSRARIDFQDDSGKKSFISAGKVGERVTLSAGNSKADFSYTKYPGDPAAPTSRQADLEAEHYRELVASSSSNDVLRLIASLPTPMFLGLDRRARLDVDDRRFSAAWRPRPSASRNVFGTSAQGSLNDAVDLAQTAYREARFASSRIGDRLQTEMLLSLLTFSQADFGSLQAPTRQEKADLERVRSDLTALPTIFGLPPEAIQKRVAPFIEDLWKAVLRIPSDFDEKEYFSTDRADPPPFMSELITWSTNRSQLKRIKVISETVAKYNLQRTRAMEPIARYTALLDKFLSDSGKSVEFDDRGSLSIKIDGVKDVRPVSSLSSGESQIFVILTHLSFNEFGQRANVFIIDEPEISLHVYWQELFVDSVLSANENIQFIMATHSPSIILDKLASCVDMTQKGRGSIRG